MLELEPAPDRRNPKQGSPCRGVVHRIQVEEEEGGVEARRMLRWRQRKPPAIAGIRRRRRGRPRSQERCSGEEERCESEGNWTGSV
jgi:hypothetical protein